MKHGRSERARLKKKTKTKETVLSVRYAASFHVMWKKMGNRRRIGLFLFGGESVGG